MRLAYDAACPDLRDAMNEWVRLHQVDPYRTPTDATVEYDPAHDEWRIEQYAYRDGHMYIDATGYNAARIVIRRHYRAALPAGATASDH